MSEVSENLDVGKQAAVMVEREQKKLMAEMRRRTTLDDEQLHALLEPFSEAAFGAGYKIGWRDAEAESAHVRVRAAMWKMAALLTTAAVVAWRLVTL